MPQIRPITDLRKTTEISEICHAKREPIFITKNGYGDLVVMSVETYEEMIETARMDAAIKRNLQKKEPCLMQEKRCPVYGGSILDNYVVKLYARAYRDLDEIYAYIYCI